MRPRSLLFLAGAMVLVAIGTRASDQGLRETLATETARNRKALETIPASELVDGERPRLKGLLDDADALLNGGRIGPAIEALASAAPGIIAVARAGSGWDDTGKASGKHIEALAKEWEEAGRGLKADRARFPSEKPGGQSEFVRAMAEQSFGQVDEHYAVAVDYGRVSGVSAGAYYLGRAEGQMAFALFLSRLTSPSTRSARSLPSLAASIAAVENEIVTAYAKPGSTAQHSNFILANSSLKLAKELDGHGWRRGALVTLLRSLFALALATLPAPAAEQDEALAESADRLQRRFAGSKRDDTIGEAFVEKARIALEKSRPGGEASNRERLRAAALLSVVLPRYLDLMEGLEK